MDEIVDVIDVQGTALKQARKADAHRYGRPHRVVIGWLRDSDSWSLVRQSAHRQDAGQLVAPVGGHVQAGEPNEAALLREAEEEIGTRNITFDYIGSAPFRRQILGRDENHLFVVYEITTADPIVLGNESVAIERFSSEELKRVLIDRPDVIGGAFYFVLQSFYANFLPAGYRSRWTK